MDGRSRVSHPSTIGPLPLRGEQAWKRALEVILRERYPLLEREVADREGTPQILGGWEKDEKNLWLAALDRRDEVCAEIVGALFRIAMGRYGVCVDCKAPIPVARLKTLLFAIRCLRCQEQHEATKDPGAQRPPTVPCVSPDSTCCQKYPQEDSSHFPGISAIH